MSSKLTAFDKLNKALGEYYESQGVTDYYGGDTPNGKFLAYCFENGFEVEDIEDELSMDAADCSYCDFDTSFPLDKSLNSLNEDERIEEIFRIIRRCYESNSSLSQLNLDLRTTPNDLKRAESIYSLQCPKIYLQSQEETLRSVFAIGLKNDLAFISYLVDSYQRDRMLYRGGDLTAASWAAQSPYICSIRRNSVIISGIQTYMKRVAPRFHWKAMNTIHDDIGAIIKYIVTSGQFVMSLLSKQEITPPFAYDVVIVVKNAVSNSKMVIPELSGSEDDEEDADIKDYDDNKNDNEKYLANINERLTNNKCKFINKTLDINDKERGYRFWMETFRDFTKELEHKYSNKKEYNIKHYPRKKRFCTLIDRRGDNKEDSMVMFEPPNDCNTLPSNHVADWYFNASKTCIVPCKGYNNDNASHDPQDTLCVDRAYNGQVITVSYHIDSSKSLRCYLFWNGCYIRIVYPQDLKYIINAIFDIKYKDNQQYMQSKQSTIDIDQLKLTDHAFDAFYKQVTITNNK